MAGEKKTAKTKAKPKPAPKTKGKQPAKKGKKGAPAPVVQNKWEGNIDRGDFLEIAALKRILISGVSVTRHVLGLVHPVSLFTPKNFTGIFWYERHSSGVHQYDFKHLIDVLPVNGAESVGETFPAALVELSRSGKYEGDLAARSMTLVFSVPMEQAKLNSDDASVASRVARDQRASFYSRDHPGASAAGGVDEDTVQLSLDIVCDNQWSYESLLEGFTLIKNHYAELLNSPEMARLQEVGEKDKDGNLESQVNNGMNRIVKDETGVNNGATRAMNMLHQLYQPEHHPNHRAKFRIKAGTEVEIMFKPSVYKCIYTKRGMEPIEVDLTNNKYFKAGKYCLGIIKKRYSNDTYDVLYVNGPFTMDVDPNHNQKPLFPRRGLMFRKVPKAFLIVDYDAQLASPWPWGMLTLSAAQTLYFIYYISTHTENAQGPVSLATGVAGNPKLYFQTMGNWPQCTDLIWGNGEYWRLASYQMVHFGINHIGFNMVAQLLFGTPIERVHGTERIVLLYELGVVGGALFAGWSDPMKIVVGASGGVYTILGAHWANMAIAWDAMKNGTVPPYARMFVLSILIGIDIFQYIFQRAEGTSYAVHLGGFLVGFVGGILVLRELEVDFWETWVVRPLAVMLFCLLIGFSIYWDTTHWPPVQPSWMDSWNFGDTTLQCCWKVWNCYDYAQDQVETEWGPAQWKVIESGNGGCNGYDLYGAYDDDGLTTCPAMYDYVYNPSDDRRID
jgi:rhomboid-related protein 1/2/3